MDSKTIRGATTYKARATQGRDFTGLRYGNITPTDIDALIEYQNKCYIFIEAKKQGADMPTGQRIALERLCDDLQRVKPTLLILMVHNTDASQEIDFAISRVDKYRYKCEWKTPQNAPTVKKLIDSFLKGIK